MKTLEVQMAYRSREEHTQTQTQKEIKRDRKCRLCLKNESVDFKDTQTLLRYINDRGKILPRRATGLCEKHQKVVSKAIKSARLMSLLPSVDEAIR